MDNKEEKLKVVFQPGCFDDFEGTQEELDEVVKEIQEMFENMSPEEFEEQGQEISLESLAESLDNDPEAIEFMKRLAGINERKLH
jgi:hypothetical protein